MAVPARPLRKRPDRPKLATKKASPKKARILQFPGAGRDLDAITLPARLLHRCAQRALTAPDHIAWRYSRIVFLAAGRLGPVTGTGHVRIEPEEA